MERVDLRSFRFVVGILLIIVGLVLLLVSEGRNSTAGAVAFFVLGLMSIAISRRDKIRK